uniref:quinolinate synthase n=1 Tax=Nelumbo nucifera TaxID=4432 RepID=A0A822YE53_NELNU|nr:TPA_asm: hypothetical protein HUJ06_009618 [Nelumbo nucifera]
MPSYCSSVYRFLVRKCACNLIRLTSKGTCIVHNFFGQEVVENVQKACCDTFLTDNLEVSGEMFSLVVEAKKRGMGVVGSHPKHTRLLDVIKSRIQEALAINLDDHLQLVLGTESGMVTSIVEAICKLSSYAESLSGRASIDIEIVFPVSSDLLSRTSSLQALDSFEAGGQLPVVPGEGSGNAPFMEAVRPAHT